MTLASMTGFARTSGSSTPYSWGWEIKTVNAKGLDVRLRLPNGFDAIEAEARARISKHLSRGTCYATLNVQRSAAVPDVRINEKVLAALLAAIDKIPLNGNLRAASLDGLLNVRGVVEVTDTTDDDAIMTAIQAAALVGLDEALKALVAMRTSEGASLGLVLNQRLTRITELTAQAENAPGRKPEAIRAKLEQSLATLVSNTNFDANRLHQEALMMAAKADIREELDRLVTHVAAARALLDKGGPIGRKLDFLAQELGRESNTLCAKSNDVSLTDIGLELRVEIEQFREQIQNIE